VLVGGLVSLTGAASATALADPVVVYPSSQSIPASGGLPRGGTPYVAANAAIGEREDAIVVVRGAERVAVAVATAPAGGVAVGLLFAHFVGVEGRAIPDALEPWDGSERASERENQPIHVQIDVPYGTRPGRYAASLSVTADGKRTVVPVRITVFRVTLPRAGSRVGNLLTSFNLSPESYVSKSAQLYGFTSHDQRVAANRALFGLLGAYRVSPGSWGFGEPRTSAGYRSDPRWWLDSAGNFLAQLRASPGFSALRIPISSNRTAAHNYIAQLSPFAPETWCEYLGRVRSFWSENEVLGAGSLPYLFGYDEPSLAGQRLVARQAKALHHCFPGGAQMMTGNPTPANAFLWDGKGGDDLDVWTVLSRRYYGTWTSPARTQAGISRARSNLALIDRVRSRRKMVWAYTYTGTPGTPGFAATEPLSNARMLMLWTALENVQGLFYAQGMTSYTSTNPRESIGSGEKILVYPGPNGPWPSARLTQIRDGVEDWAILDLLRRRRGQAEVQAVLGNAGLFSAGRQGVRLGCTLGCELRSPTTYAWPRWSRDVSTPRRIESAHLAALRRL
jgi:glycosyl hydrolase family 123